MPVATLLQDGFKTLIAITGVTALFEEIEVQPSALDAGGPISQSTMRNTRYRTSMGKKLITQGKLTVKVAYDPAVIPQMVGILGVNKSITKTFPNGNTVQFWGFVDKFTPDTMKEGDRPEATMEIEVTNLNASNAETGPVFTASTTTT
jgi:hypothetical protein